MDNLPQGAIQPTHRVWVRYCGLLIVVLSILGLMLLGVLHVARNRWMTNGPPGKTVYSIAVPVGDVQTIYAATWEDGVYKSMDGGDSWKSLNNGLDNLNTNDIAVDGQGAVYVGTYGGGVFELPLNASSWRPRNEGLDNAHVYSVDIASDGSLYAGTNGNGIYKSANGGDHWISQGLADFVIYCQIIDPRNDQIIYVGTWGEGVYRTSDGGDSWSPVSEGLGNLYIGALAVDHDNPLVLYAGTWGDGVYKTTNGGESWTAMNPGLDNLEIYALAITDDGETVYVGTNGDGIYRTVRGADSWVPYGLEGLVVPSLDLTAYPVIYAGTDDGVCVYDVSLEQRFSYGAVGLSGMLIVGLLVTLVTHRLAPSTQIERVGLGEDAWEQSIQKPLLEGKPVEAKMFKGLSREAAVRILEEYRRRHPQQDLVYVESAQRLALRNETRVGMFSSSWTQALVAMSDNQFEAFESHVDAITDAFCETLGFVRLLQSDHYKRLLGIMVKTPTLRLGIPFTFPIIYLYRHQFAVEDIVDLRDLMAVMNVSHRFALVVTSGDPQAVQQMLDEHLRSFRNDFVVLDKDRIQAILAAKDSRQVLIQAILEQVELTVISPFSTAGPAPENMFIGRDRELREIEGKIVSLSLALVGSRRVGKTSIMLRVQRTLLAQGRTVLFLDCYPASDYKDFFDLINMEWELDGLPITNYSPLSLAKLIPPLSQASSPVIVLLDEVDALLSYDEAHDWALARTFRSLSQKGRCRFLFAGIKTLYHQSHNSEAPFFNFCHTLVIRYLERKDAERLIVEPMTSMGIVLENERELLNRILGISMGHPSIVQQMCEALVEEISKEGSRQITLQHVDAVCQSSEFQTYCVETILGVATPLEKIIALTLEDGKYTLTEIRQKVSAHGITPTYTELDEALDHLKLYSVLQETGKRYDFLAKGFPGMARESLDVEAEIEMLKENLHAQSTLPNY